MLPFSDEAGSSAPSGLGDYLVILRRRKVLAISVIVLVIAFAVVYTVRQDPIYQSSVTLAIRTPLDGTSPADDRSTDPNRALRNEIEFISSDVMSAEVEKRIADPASVKVEAADEADVITITATGTDPKLVAATANEFAAAYKRLRIAEVLSANAKSATELDKLLMDVGGQINEINKPIAAIDLQIAGMAPGPELEDLRTQRASLVNSSQARIEALVAQQTSYRSERAAIDRQSQVIRSQGIRTLQEASVPDEPIGPSLVNNLIIAGVVGVVLAAAAVLLAEYFDDSVKAQADLDRIVHPVLSAIPLVRKYRPGEVVPVVSITAPLSPEAEAYRSLRTSVKSIGLQRAMRIVQITSPMPGEGKSITAANLAVVMARAGDRVLVVSADLRRPRVESYLGIESKHGLTSVLVGDVSIADALVPSDDVPGLFVLPTGGLPPNPSELLAWQRTQELIERLADEFSVVIIDSPPILPVTDALVSSRFCDATIVVARAGATPRRRLRRAVELLGMVEATVAGSVLTNASSREDYVGDGYQGIYGEKAESYRSNRRARRAERLA